MGLVKSCPSPAVAHQWLVYAKGRHFSEISSVNTVGGVTVYRLPFWHYTTPLVARPGAQEDARRWLRTAPGPDDPWQVEPLEAFVRKPQAV